jgi:hypothetical protein
MKKLIVAVVLLLMQAAAFAGSIDFDPTKSNWTADRVKVTITGVPAHTLVSACVYEDASGCVIKACTRYFTELGGEVTLTIPKQDGAFAAGDKVQVSDPDCGILVAGGSIQDLPSCTPCPCDDPDCLIVPSLTEYGLIGLAAILVLSGVWIFWRRRALA